MLNEHCQNVKLKSLVTINTNQRPHSHQPSKVQALQRVPDKTHHLLWLVLKDLTRNSEMIQSSVSVEQKVQLYPCSNPSILGLKNDVIQQV